MNARYHGVRHDNGQAPMRNGHEKSAKHQNGYTMSPTTFRGGRNDRIANAPPGGRPKDTRTVPERRLPPAPAAQETGALENGAGVDEKEFV